MSGYAWVTLATNDSYSLGALVLGNSLKRVGTKHDLAVLVTPGVTPLMREKLATVFSLVQEVNVLDSKDKANLALLARPELGVTFTKLHCWRLTQYDKCVFVDADTLVVRNCDELFEREELSAAPDVGWPDCFNSGVFVFKPSMETFESVVAFAVSKGSFDGGDQGLLNSYFSDWAWKDINKHLPFIYNMCSTATYSYLPAFKQFGDNVRIIHFIGSTKPWLQYFDTMTGIVQPPPNSTHLQPLLQLWWNIFCEFVHPQLTPNMAGLAGALAQITLGQPRSAEQIAFEEHMRKQSWEQGQIDFMGRDSFDNIWKKICDTLSQAPQRQPTPPKETAQPKSKTECEVEKITADTASLSLEPETVKEAEEVEKEKEKEEEEEEEEAPSSEKISENILEERIPEEMVTAEPDYSKEVVNPILAAIQANVDQLCTELTSKLLESAVPSEESAESTKNTDVCPLKVSSETVEEKLAEQTVETIDDNDDACPLNVSSEKVTKEELLKESDKCPVPIQVAESVLQAEPKESVSEVPKPVEQVISCSVDILQEAVATRSEILAQATALGPVSDLKNGVIDETPAASLKCEVLPKDDCAQAVEERARESKPEDLLLRQVESREEEEIAVEEAEIKPVEKLESEETGIPLEERKVAKGKELELEIPCRKQEEAGEAELLSDVPPTPTVTEPTPPTSPPIQPEDVEKSAKKKREKTH